MTSKSCTEIYNDTKSNKFLIISKLDISKSDLEEIIRDSIRKARSIKKQKSLEKKHFSDFELSSRYYTGY